MSRIKAPDLKDFTDIRKYNNASLAHTEELKKEGEKTRARIALLKAKKALKETKLPTEKRHKDDYKRVKGNIQKSRSDLHVNKSTGKREITTNMTIHKGLTAKEKTGLKKSILKAVKQHLEGSGLHIPLAGGYTSSLIFHEMGKYIPPKDRVLMRKLIEESRPPRPPPIHSGAIDEEVPLAVVPPMDTGNISDSDYSSSGTDSESDIEPKYKMVEKQPDSDSDSDDDMFGGNIGADDFARAMMNMNKQIVEKNGGLKPIYAKGKGFGDFMNAVKKGVTLTKKAINAPKRIKNELEKQVETGTGIKRGRGRPRKIQL
jgi:hypothetical protein